MKVSINTAVFLTDLQAQTSQLDCLRRLTDSAIAAIEVRGEFFKPKTKDAELAAISTLCQQQHWQFYYSVPEELFQGDHLNPTLAATLKMAQQYHIKALKFSLGNITNITTADLIALRQQLAATTIQVTIENQPNANGILATFAQRLAWLKQQQLPLGYTFDAGNWCWVATDPLAAFMQVQPAITIFHLKAIRARTTVLLDTQPADWQQMLNRLAADIPVFLEYAIPAEQLAAQIALVNQQLVQRQALL
ncbi:sugar phosphate isomerase/epimerase family protein [Loigolactobacillus binensis]|uniref:Sugar phosphate isomerase/epimerase family protein n=1 Tax=Loigolactobacillus binensis TaxID=2559922 RepID=A0ABW3E9Q5_9LACO|nr:sugar phosphate isomerase/epimerase [Loigolactobacillus binensis]